MATEIYKHRKRQKGSGSKSSKDPGATSRSHKRKRHHDRLLKRKDRRVERSSHGKFLTVAALETHRLSVTAKPRLRLTPHETTSLTPIR